MLLLRVLSPRELLVDKLMRSPSWGVGEIEGVNRLDTHRSRLGNAEEGKRDSESETTGPNKSDTSTDSGLNLRSGKGDDEVEEPVGTGTEGDTPRRQPNGESLTADNPGNGTPRRRERGNEKTGEGNENITGNLVIRVGLGDSTDNNLTNKHENATNEEDRSSTRSVDSKNTGERENDVDGSENDLEDVGVVKTGSLGELDTVREEEVDTGDLLANLDTDTDHSSPENSVLGRETFDIAGLTALLVFDGSLTDFFHLGIDVRVISRKTTEIGKVLSAVVPSALLGKESRRLRGKEETDEQQSSPDHLKRYGDSP